MLEKSFFEAAENYPLRFGRKRVAMYHEEKQDFGKQAM
jgi:hypothetical protein